MSEKLRPWKDVVVVCLIVAGAILIASGCGPTKTVTTARLKPLAGEFAQRCRAGAGGQLPDPACTPGAINQSVNKSNIGRTICKSGYTKTVRPSTKYTNALKARQIVQYGYTDTNPHDYEEDHLISLELGGDPIDPRNLWPERGASPNDKDKAENRLHSEVCSDQIPLAQAQREIASDWRAAR